MEQILLLKKASCGIALSTTFLRAFHFRLFNTGITNKLKTLLWFMALMSESFSDKLFSTTIEVDFLFHPELEHK